jgi:site-specific DNA recombinase
MPVEALKPLSETAEEETGGFKMSEPMPHHPSRRSPAEESGHSFPEDERGVLAAIYARTSSPNQRFNYSLDEQIKLCRERCEQRGWTVRYIYRENGLSAKNTARPKFRMMMERAREGAFDVIVFWKLDRFCRSLADLVNTERMLREWGVGLHSVTEQIDTTTPVGRFNFRSLASVAELERDLIGERARMGLHALARKHGWPNPWPPLGYDRGADGCLKVNPHEAALVRRIFKMYVELKSMPQVAFILNREGVLTKRGKRWTQAAVRKILDNRLYIGEYRVAGVEDYVEEYRILDSDLFERA